MTPSVSIIIPTLNEEIYILKTLQSISNNTDNLCEVIVSDGGSNDQTEKTVKKYARTAKPHIRFHKNNTQGRAHQMNEGAKRAQGDILLFLHADTILPPQAIKKMKKALQDQHLIGGAFHIRFDNEQKWYRHLETWSNKIRAKQFKRYYGDQAIFIRKNIFTKINGFPEYPLMEDIAFSSRMNKAGKTVLLQEYVVTSSRRIEANGFIKTVVMYNLLHFLYLIGIPPKIIAKLHNKLKKQNIDIDSLH